MTRSSLSTVTKVLQGGNQSRIGGYRIGKPLWGGSLEAKMKSSALWRCIVNTPSSRNGPRGIGGSVRSICGQSNMSVIYHRDPLLVSCDIWCPSNWLSGSGFTDK